jgi:hypothetical protein
VRLNSRLEGRALLEALVAKRDGAGRKAKAKRDASQEVAICTGLFLYSSSISPLILLLFWPCYSFRRLEGTGTVCWRIPEPIHNTVVDY